MTGVPRAAGATAGSTPAAPRPPGRVATAVTAVLLGGAGLFLTPRSISTGRSDPSFYLGYALDYPDLAARYGQTYHGNRLSYLLFEMGAFRLLGPEPGYLALRWLMLAAAVAVVLRVAVPRIGWSLALPLAVLAAASPWLARQLLWTHYDGVAAVLLLVASVVLVRSRGRAAHQVAAGVLLGLVVNANLSYLLFVGSLGIAWVLTSAESPRARLGGAVRVAGGAVAIELVLSAVLRALGADGPWFIEVVPARFALRHVGDDTWFTPLPDVLRENPHLVVVAIVALLAALAARRTRRSDGGVAALAAWWLGTSSVLLLAGHVVFRAGWLGLPFYVVLLVPGTIMGLVGVAAVLRPDGEGARPVVAVSGIGWVALLLWSWWRGHVQPWTVPVGAVAAIVLLVALLRPTSRLRLAAAVVLPALALPVWASPTQVPEPGVGGHAVSEQREWDVFRAIVAVQGLVSEQIPRTRDLVFWHAAEGDDADVLRRINMVQYGQGTGRLHRDKGDLIGMPDLPPVLVDELRLRQPTTVILLAWDRRELLAGLVALGAAVPEAEQIEQRVIEGDVLDLHVALVEVG